MVHNPVVNKSVDNGIVVRYPKFTAVFGELLCIGVLRWFWRASGATFGSGVHSGGVFLRSSGLWVDAGRGVDFVLFAFGHGSFSRMEGASVGLSEGCGHALLSFKDFAQGIPAVAESVSAQLFSYGLDESACDDGYEEMAFGAFRFAAIYGARAEFGFEGSEDGFKVRERGVCSPEGFFVPFGYVAAQATDAGMCGHGAFEGFAGPRYGCGFFSAFVVGDANAVALGGSPAFSFNRPMRFHTASMRLRIRGRDRP